MRSRLRFFAVVGVIATAVDLGLLLALAGRVTRPTSGQLIQANAVALSAAALVAYLLNRKLTFKGDPRARWVSHPGLFAATAVAAGMVDSAVLLAAQTLIALAPAKMVSITFGAAVRWFVYRWILFTQVRRDLAARVPRPDPPGRFRLTLLLPAYNEGQRVATTIETMRRQLLTEVDPDQLEILVVDDGSSDETAEAAAGAGARVLGQGRNQGKGAAVRAGMLAAEGRSVVFTDADMAYSPGLVLRILHELEDGWDMVVGSRRHEQATALVQARRIRELGGRLVNRLTHLVLLGHFRDTQCGIKGFRSDIGQVVFERSRIDGFAFDVELFLIAEQDQLSLQEIPVSVENRAGSSVRVVADTMALLADLFRIRKWVGEGVYKPSEDQQQVLRSRV
ncbi:MAG: glycosyltransferase [Acidimicrobiia bacterium]|nr:glycosyltransferase [Acidimicrobiia bacterium]